jgi:hypothetical protein
MHAKNDSMYSRVFNFILVETTLATLFVGAIVPI